MMSNPKCPDCGNELTKWQDGSESGWACHHCEQGFVQGDDRLVDDDGIVITSRQVAWCCDCGEKNFTNLPADSFVCFTCKHEYDQFNIASKEDTYEQTLDSDGNADFDAFVPDYPDTDDESDEAPDAPVTCFICGAEMMLTGRDDYSGDMDAVCDYYYCEKCENTTEQNCMEPDDYDDYD